MNKNLLYDFSVDKENNAINIKKELAAPVSVVWDAYTKSEILDQWWAPKPWKARTKKMDFRAGGSWLYAMVGPQGEEHWSFINYQEVEQQKRFTGTDGFSDPEGNVNKDMPQSKWSVSFSGKGDITLVELRITFSDLAQLETTIKMGFREGLTMALEGLEELLPSLQKS